MIDFEVFHFLRPFWLLGLIPIALLVVLLLRARQAASGWRAIVDEALLPYLLEGEDTGEKGRQYRIWLAALLAAGWLAIVLALAGPVWERLPQPVEVRKNALVILFDLSFSMTAQDILPTRLDHAKFKLADVLARRKEGQTALVVYAGDAYTVVPFTDDPNTISNLLPALSPNIMPLPGSRADLALIEANRLFTDNKIVRGRVLLITDGIEPVARFRNVIPAEHDLAVIGVGTPEGAPIPDPRNPASGFLKNSSGHLVIVTLDHQATAQWIRQSGGVYSPLTLDDTDLDLVLPDSWWAEMGASETTEREYEIFIEQGHWLILLCLPMLLGLFRRNALAVLLVLVLPVISSQGVAGGAPAASEPRASQARQPPVDSNALAELWSRLWQSSEQKGVDLLEQNKPEQALAYLQSPDWRATAHYRQGDYEQAQDIWSEGDDEGEDGNAEDGNAENAYNKGNALAWQGNFDEALAAYESALEKQPEMEDALANRALMLELLGQTEQGQPGEGEEQDGESEQAEGQQGQSGEGEEQQAQSGEGEEEQAQGADQMSEQSEEEGSEDSQAQSQETPEGDDSEDQTSLARKDDENQDDESTEEEKQALQQWLRRIPDDPGGLLKRKFQHEAQQRQRERQSGRRQENIW